MLTIPPFLALVPIGKNVTGKGYCKIAAVVDFVELNVLGGARIPVDVFLTRVMVKQFYALTAGPFLL